MSNFIASGSFLLVLNNVEINMKSKIKNEERHWSNTWEW